MMTFDAGAHSYRVLLALDEKSEPAATDRTRMERLLRAALFIALSQHAVSLTVLGLVQVAEGQSLSQGALPAQAQRSLLNELIGSVMTKIGWRDVGIATKTVVRVCAVSELAQELNDVILEEQIDLLLLGSNWFEKDFGGQVGQVGRSPLEEIVRRPLCDMAIIGPGVNIETSRDILLAARGGPFAELALRLASGIVAQTDGQVTLLHVSRNNQPDYGLESDFEEQPFNELERNLAGHNRVRRKQVVAANVQEAILQEAQNYQLILLGATATNANLAPSRTEALLQNPFGPVARAVLAQAELAAQEAAEVQENNPDVWLQNGPGVIVVRAGAPRDTYFARLQRRKQQNQAQRSNENYISTLVDKWFAENTFDADEFADIERLIALKNAQGLTISLGLPALNEETTVGHVISVIKSELFDKWPLLDEIVLIDSNSIDRTREVAAELGVPVHLHQEVLTSQGVGRGKGEALWKSLYVLKGDIILWVDTDVTNMHPRFIYGLVGPLLKDPRLQYVKGYYRRPLQIGDKTYETGGGRVTELTVRPLFNLFFPELSGFIQPLSGEYAGRRTCLEQLPFFTGYGVETGHLIDTLEAFGLQALGQVNLAERRHRNQELGSLSQMAFAITQVIINRLEQRERMHLTDEMNRAMKLINIGPQGLHLEMRNIADRERPPMLEVPEYRQQHRKRLIRLAK